MLKVLGVSCFLGLCYSTQALIQDPWLVGPSWTRLCTFNLHALCSRNAPHHPVQSMSQILMDDTELASVEMITDPQLQVLQLREKSWSVSPLKFLAEFWLEMNSSTRTQSTQSKDLSPNDYPSHLFVCLFVCSWFSWTDRWRGLVALYTDVARNWWEWTPLLSLINSKM